MSVFGVRGAAPLCSRSDLEVRSLGMKVLSEGLRILTTEKWEGIVTPETENGWGALC